MQRVETVKRASEVSHPGFETEVLVVQLKKMNVLQKFISLFKNTMENI